MLIVVFVLIGVLAIAAPVGIRFWRLVSYARQQRIGAELIGSLHGRRPETIPKKTWEDATGWASISYNNVCFSESHVAFDELVRFNHDARLQLEGNVGLHSIDWVWERLAETGPHGKRYFEIFHPEYRSLIYRPQNNDTKQ